MSEVQESQDLHSMMRFIHLRMHFSVSIVSITGYLRWPKVGQWRLLHVFTTSLASKLHLYSFIPPCIMQKGQHLHSKGLPNADIWVSALGWKPVVWSSSSAVSWQNTWPANWIVNNDILILWGKKKKAKHYNLAEAPLFYHWAMTTTSPIAYQPHLL